MNQTNEKKFSGRGLVSVLTTFSFIGLVFTGVVLFIVPPGWFVNSVGWSLLGLEKTQWQTLHNCFGLTFLGAVIFHIYLNWRPLLSYFKSRRFKRFAFRWDWILPVVFCGVILAGVVAQVPPFTTLAEWKDQVKRSWEEDYYADLPQLPPVDQLPDMTLSQLADETGLAVEVIVSNLENQGLPVESTDITIGEFAAANNTTIQRIGDLAIGLIGLGGGSGSGGELQSGAGHRAGEEHIGGKGGGLGRGSGAGQGERAGTQTSRGTGLGGGRGGAGGIGQMTLEQFCNVEGADLEAIIKKLHAKGIEASAKTTLRLIADQLGVHPRDLRGVLLYLP